MLSIAQSHRVKVESGRVLPEPVAPNNALRPYLFKLKADVSRLKSIKSREDRTRVKREILADYQPIIDGLLVSQAQSSDVGQMVAWLILWKLDVGDLHQFIELARYALNAGFAAPYGFNRSLAEAIAEDYAVYCLQHDPKQCLSGLSIVWELMQGRDIADPARAKLAKAYGFALLEQDNAKALELLERAQALYKRVGVAKQLRKLRGEQVRQSAANAVVGKNFDISTNQAAKRLGVSIATFLKYSRTNAAELPYLDLTSNGRRLFKFASEDIDKFKAKRLVIN